MNGDENDSIVDLYGIGNVRSRLGITQVLVRFHNSSGRNADVIWIDLEGRGVLYGRLRPGAHLDISTYETHPWIFRETSTGEVLVGSPDNSEIFYPKRSHTNIIARTTVNISFKLKTLSDWAARTIANSLRKDGSLPQIISSLPIPISQRDIIRHYLFVKTKYLSNRVVPIISLVHRRPPAHLANQQPPILPPGPGVN